MGKNGYQGAKGATEGPIPIGLYSVTNLKKYYES